MTNTLELTTPLKVICGVCGANMTDDCSVFKKSGYHVMPDPPTIQVWPCSACAEKTELEGGAL